MYLHDLFSVVHTVDTKNTKNTKGSGMDKLTRESNEHGKIVESMAFFKKFLEAFTNEKDPNYIEKLHQFSDEYIVKHFKFEEEEIFPFILKGGDAEESRLVQELHEEHVQILEALTEFNDMISSYASQPNREQIKEILKLSEGVVNMVLDHAQKEDKQLFPALRKYNI
jgi:hemerythrin-like domain-containing protein